MTWNYRIVKHDLAPTRYFAIHEVFYDEKGDITNWTVEPIDMIGETKRDIISMLKQMNKDIVMPILKESELTK